MIGKTANEKKIQIKFYWNKGQHNSINKLLFAQQKSDLFNFVRLHIFPLVIHTLPCSGCMPPDRHTAQLEDLWSKVSLNKTLWSTVTTSCKHKSRFVNLLLPTMATANVKETRATYFE